MQISIFSEIDSLKSVLLHRPGNEQSFVKPENLIEWISHDNQLIHNPNYLLFDDLIHPSKAMEEHDLLSQVLQNFIGKENCLEFTTLLSDILKDTAIQKLILIECLELECLINHNKLSQVKLAELESMDTPQVLQVLLTGENPQEPEKKYFQHPIPNLIFTRDIAAVIGQTILLTWGCRMVRKRENILAKFIFTYHERFKDIKTYDFHANYPDFSIEGGDIIILDDKTICIGMGERTSSASVNALLPLFFEEGFKRVYAIDLPKRRSVMHLDTIFNRISKDEVVVFPPMFIQSESTNDLLTVYCISPGEILEEGKKSTQKLLEVLDNDGIHLQPIKCGGNNKHHQKREQWMDGANYFVISPGIILGYERNQYTTDALKNAGYICVKAIEFLRNTKLYENQSKLMISIPSGELSRGRGGARCLTLPLMRVSN